VRDPVLTDALHCCSRASPSTSSPTFNCPLPRLRRPPADLNAARGHHRQGLRSERQLLVGQRTIGPWPADLNAATTNKDCNPSGAPLVGQRTMGPGPQGWWHMSCGGIACLRLASSGVGGVRRVRLAFGRHPMHLPHT